jgi:predicted metal-dependent hydrolase
MLSYKLIRSRRTTVQISVLPDRTVVVRAPLFAPQQKIAEIVAGKEQWIQKKISTRTAAVILPVHYAYVPGETISFLGKAYTLRAAGEEYALPHTLKERVYIEGSDLIVRARTAGVDSVQKAVEAWQKKQAYTVFSEILDSCWHRFSEQYPGAVKPELHIRTMKTRWGSLSNPRCRSSSGFCLFRGPANTKMAAGKPPHMTLNTLLICAEPYCILQVVYHELCHLVHPDHSRAFYQTLATFVPDWKETKKRLEQTFCPV